MALDDNVTAKYLLDEASGNRLPTIGPTTLTDHNSVLSGPGIISPLAAKFSAPSLEWLSNGGTFDSGNVDWAMMILANLDDKAGDYGLIDKWLDSINRNSFRLFYAVAPDRYSWWVSSNGSNGVFVNADSFGSPVAGVWNLIIMHHWADEDEIGIQIDNGPINRTSHSLGVHQNASQGFVLGAQQNHSVNFLNGSLQQFRFFEGYKITDQDREDAFLEAFPATSNIIRPAIKTATRAPLFVPSSKTFFYRRPTWQGSKKVA